MESAFRKVAENCLAQVHANEAAVATGQSAEGVHQMRVGLRRFRSALDIFSDVVTFPAELEEGVKWIANELGASRDWEVLAHTTLPQITEGKQQAVLPEVIEAAGGIARARRHDAAEAVRSARYARLVLALGQWIEGSAWRDVVDPARQKLLEMPARKLARTALRKRHRRLVRRGRGLHKLDGRQRHRARIAAKKLRYAAEFFGSLLPQKPLKEYRLVLAKLQDDLGWGNDLAVAGRLLQDLRNDNEALAGSAGYAQGFLAARVEADRENQRRLWKRFRQTDKPW